MQISHQLSIEPTNLRPLTTAEEIDVTDAQACEATQPLQSQLELDSKWRSSAIFLRGVPYTKQSIHDAEVTCWQLADVILAHICGRSTLVRLDGLYERNVLAQEALSFAIIGQH